jgi:hypothetical protein
MRQPKVSNHRSHLGRASSTTRGEAVPLADRLARAVLEKLPSVGCLSCLSLQLGVRQKDARDASQLLAMREEFFIAERV